MRISPTNVAWLITVIALVSRPSTSYYLPGIAPVDYIQGAPIDVIATRLTSTREKLPFPYYSLPFCRPEEEKKPMSMPVNLGQILVGERAYPTSFDIHMEVPQSCTFMCSVDLAKVPKTQFKALKRRIKQGYSVRLSADNLPVISNVTRKSGTADRHFGYDLGFVKKNEVYINNHLEFTIFINTPSMSPRSVGSVVGIYSEEEATLDEFRVVGFEVKARSIAFGSKYSNSSCTSLRSPQPVASDELIMFSYSVEFRLSAQDWATRWDPLLERSADIKIGQWHSFTNALLIGAILGGLVAVVITRTLSRDFAVYEEFDGTIRDDPIGWKALKGDVFRTPKYPLLLSICVGTGSQIFVVALLTQCLAVVGFLSPANRGALLSALVMFYVLSSFVCGYSTARVYSQWDEGSSRKLVTFGSAFLFPGICFSIFFALNLAVSFTGSSSAVPFRTLLLLLFFWVGVSAPLVVLGSVAGYRQVSKGKRNRTNQIASDIPAEAQRLTPLLYVTGGIVPFGCIFAEIVFTLDDFNKGHLFVLYGTAFTLFAILLVTTAEISVIITYVGLCKGNWKWSWQAFGSNSSIGLYVFVYALYYMFKTPDGAPEGAAFIAWLVYISYMGISCGAFALMCGCIGFCTSQWFVHTIYRRVSSD
jgi:transmembrane 9 superfamily member 2/4